MSILASIRRPFPTSFMTLAWSAFGICGMALIVAGAAGDDPVDPAKKASPAPEDKCTVKAPVAPAEAPAGFESETNGFIELKADFEKDRGAFEQTETVAEGLGPVYNATSCVACHQNPVTGSSSQIAEIRAGRTIPDPNDPSPRKVKFVEPLHGSVIHQRAIEPKFQEFVKPEYNVRTLRMSNTILGDGFIEVIPDCEILKIKKAQRAFGMEGFAVVVTAAVGTEKPATCDSVDEFIQVERIGRFGWKCQEASLLNFSAGAYVVEMGITSPLHPQESHSTGMTKPLEDKKCDPEGKKPAEVHPFGVDVEAFTRFMRSTKVPPRDTVLAATPDAVAGEKLFRNNQALGCAICHHPDYTTPPAGTPIETLGGKRGSDMATVHEKLGNKIIHPYSDFLLHDIGTGDGIAQTQHANLPSKGYEKRDKIPDATKKSEGLVRVKATADPEQSNRRVLEGDFDLDQQLEQRIANKMRTAPLWGLRVRPQLMHDGLSLTIDEAIRRHHGQAEGVRLKYEGLSDTQRKQLLAFLNSL